MIFRLIPPACCLLLLCSGCLFRPAVAVSRYDLPVERTCETQANALEFENLSGSGTAYSFTAGDGAVGTTRSFKWILPPERLVPSALNRCFKGAATRDVRGEIRTFTERDGAFVLDVVWTAGSGPKHAFHAAVPVEGDNPASRAAAAARAVEELAGEITKRLDAPSSSGN